MKWLVVCVLLAVSLLAGCTAPGGSEEEAIYTHQWAYGPGYGGGDGFPVFEDTFLVEDQEVLIVAIEWDLKKGRAAIELTPPTGDGVNFTDEETAAPDGGAEARLEGVPGEWQFRIPTWRDTDSAYPAGAVTVRVTPE